MLQLVDMVNNYKNETQGRLEDPQTLTRKYRSIEGFPGTKKVLYLTSAHTRNTTRGKLTTSLVYSHL